MDAPKEGDSKFVYGGWCYVTRVLRIVGNEVYEPGLEKNELWWRVYSHTRRVGSNMYEHLIVAQLRDRQEDLELEWWYRLGGGDWTVEPNTLLEEAGLWNLKVELSAVKMRMSVSYTESQEEIGMRTHLSIFACALGSWGNLALLTIRTSLL
jgi:hypothetical protein